jgi:hypothetical protein
VRKSKKFPAETRRIFCLCAKDGGRVWTPAPTPGFRNRSRRGRCPHRPAVPPSVGVTVPRPVCGDGRMVIRPYGATPCRGAIYRAPGRNTHPNRVYAMCKTGRDKSRPYGRGIRRGVAPAARHNNHVAQKRDRDAAPYGRGIAARMRVPCARGCVI